MSKFCVLILVIAVNLSLINCAVTTGQEAFDLVPYKYRDTFIRLHLALGLMKSDRTYIQSESGLSDALGVPEGTVEKLLEQPVPEDFSENLFTWAGDEFNLSSYDVYQIVHNSVVCFPSGCVVPGDLGSTCCPF